MTQQTGAVQAVLFDYGQVLSGPPHPPAWTRMLEITALAPDAFHDAYWMDRISYDRGTHSGQTYWRTAGSHAGLVLDDSQVAALIEQDTALWTQPNQPMIDWAARLHAAGTRTGILSNLGDAMMHGVLSTFPWLTNFDYLLWSHTLGMVKPDRAIYDAAVAGLGVPASSILFVDDRLENIEGAVAAGLQAIQYVDQQGFENELYSRGLDYLWHQETKATPNHSRFGNDRET